MDRRSFIVGAASVPLAVAAPVAAAEILPSPAAVKNVTRTFRLNAGVWTPVAELGDDGKWREITTGKIILEHDPYMWNLKERARILRDQALSEPDEAKAASLRRMAADLEDEARKAARPR